ncbi:hypothetical protein DET49_10372 [Salegentibacter sp. 24]|uniref:hypothetical protein n=1 Tax=Salegentibacter sp. 24 TaxID=2183986 RepID=UPI00106181CF|nr:hypothetical protein [Salegentibacter sp. 24]TDN95006.1 hypothetical protein DET49_10372 [Salegentibacter sp. 24]
MRYWKNLYNTLSKEQKLLFLKELLTENESVRSQFISRYKRESSDDFLWTKALLLQFFDKEKTQILKQLEHLDFVDFDWDNYIPRHSGYIPDYEACEYMGEDMVIKVLKIPGEQILNYIRQGKIIEGATLLAAVYQACTEVYYEENYAFEDPEEEFLQLFQPTYDKALREIKSVIISDEQILVFFETLFTQYEGFGEDLKYFESLLMSLIQDEKIAFKMQKLLEKYKIDEEILPKLTLQLYELMGEQNKWIDHANKYFRQNEELAEKLMNYYLEIDRKQFLETATEIFSIYPHTFDRYLLENLNLESELPLFKMVLRRITLYERDIQYYYRLRDLFSPEEKELFYKEIWDNVFLVNIFETEKRYDLILQLVYSNSDSWDFNELILPIIPVYPQQCFEILENKIYKTLDNQRGRSAYQRITEMMKLLMKIEGKLLQTNQIIHSAYHHTPALPALKDEIRKAGLI